VPAYVLPGGPTARAIHTNTNFEYASTGRKETPETPEHITRHARIGK
jgi:hypothetical protein